MLHFTPPPLARDQRRPAGFIPPALLMPATKVPTGAGWIHELKHDGIRLIARKDGERVQLWSRHGRSRTADFRTIVAAMWSLTVRSAVFDGEAVAHCRRRLPVEKSRRVAAFRGPPIGDPLKRRACPLRAGRRGLCFRPGN